MSDFAGPSCSHSREGTSRVGKPRHVRSLNFGRSILELDVAEQRDIPNRATLVIDQNVASIPCTIKKDFVLKWIETHEVGERDLSNSDASQLSPILKTSSNKVCERSPILGTSGMRCKRNTRRAKRVTENVDRPSQQIESSCEDEEESQEARKNFCEEVKCTSPCAENSETNGSPVLGRRFYSYKKKRRKLRHVSEHGTPVKRLLLRNIKSASSHVTETHSNHKVLKGLSVSRDMLEHDSNYDIVKTVFPIETDDSTNRLQMSAKTQIQESPSSEDSSSHNYQIDSKIEINTSNDNGDNECNRLSSSKSDSHSDSLSNLIEEVDTQEMLPITRASEHSSKSLLTSKQPSRPSQLTANNLEETYCSEAEIMQDQSMHLSARVSLEPSLSKEATGSKCTQTAVISTISTPSKMSPDRNMYACLLDSGKKRRKPKKGSMVARLHSLINTQISDIRIWRHRMGKKQDAASARFISVLVKDCSQRFGNQFLNGILLEDSFNLLQSDAEVEETELDNLQTPGRIVHRNVTIMLVCNIVGKLKMVSEVVINVYPPWDVLDKHDLTLIATYITLSENRDIPHVNYITDKREKRVVKEFNCPCIEEERELPFCARKPCVDKPDVMQQIFNF